MGLDIGRLLYGIRTKYQISVNDICRGICGVSTYCMYENDEMIPDILSVNIFLDRMGFGILGLTAYISEKEVVYFKWKEPERVFEMKTIKNWGCYWSICRPEMFH